jgi:hypothetical protein
MAQGKKQQTILLGVTPTGNENFNGIKKNSVGERPYLTTKIITLSEFFNFIHQVSRL